MKSHSMVTTANYIGTKLRRYVTRVAAVGNIYLQVCQWGFIMNGSVQISVINSEGQNYLATLVTSFTVLITAILTRLLS